jgi:hypothetical protein
LCKLNASYVHYIRDLNKALANIALLCGEVDEACDVVDKPGCSRRYVKAAVEPQELIVAGLDDSFVDDEDDASSIALPDGASANLIAILPC